MRATALFCSGNTLSARTWTDGKRTAPLLPSPPAVVQCEGCGTSYWLRDAAVVSGDALRAERDRVGSAARDIPHLREPSEAGYYEAIRAGLAAQREEEKTLRILAWWRGNDRHRDPAADGQKSSDAAILAEAHHDNLAALIPLLSEATPDELLMKAEALRELGRFEEACTTLARVKGRVFTPVVQQIRMLCERRDMQVRELKP